MQTITTSPSRVWSALRRFLWTKPSSSQWFTPMCLKLHSS
jgi:hypothetical protein